MSATGHRLIRAFLTGHVVSATPLLASDARFHSPIRDYVGADQIESVWRAVAGVVQNAEPTSLYQRDNETIAFFVGTIKSRAIDGVLRTVTDENDRVADVTLMIRPWAALRAGIADIQV